MSKIHLKKLNNEKVEAIPLPKETYTSIKGESIIPEAYANIFLCAKKKSGKTCAIFKILKDCAGKDTKIIVFCGTVHKDKNWLAIKEYFEKKKRPFEAHQSLKDDDGKDILNELVQDLQTKAEMEEEEKEHRAQKQLEKKYAVKKQKFIYTSDSESESEDEPEVKSTSKTLIPEYIVVLDDLSSELKSKSLVQLLKKNRHFKMKIIVSSQYYKDILPESRKNSNIFILFGGLPEKILKTIYQDATLDLPEPTFFKIYKLATREKFNFLMIDTDNLTFRHNFDTEMIPSDYQESKRKSKTKIESKQMSEEEPQDVVRKTKKHKTDESYESKVDAGYKYVKRTSKKPDRRLDSKLRSDGSVQQRYSMAPSK